MDASQIASLLIFGAVMALIVTEKVHRAIASLLGAMVILVTRRMEFTTALHHIDANTLGVLIAMMIFVGIIKESGLFEYLAIKAAKIARGDPWKIMVALIVVTAVLSAMLDNVTTVLLVGPMTFMICRELHINPVPFLITQIMASNIGGTATLIGDPPNIMIGSAASLTFADFILIDGPIAVIVLAAVVVFFRILYGRKLKATAENVAAVMALDEKEAIKSTYLFRLSVVMIGVVTVGFCLHGLIHVESSIIAGCAAVLMALLSGVKFEKVLRDVEWPTIAFFTGLFIVVGYMVETGLIRELADFLVEATHGKRVAAMLSVLVVSAVVSAILDNIPFTATMIPVLLSMGAAGVDVTPLWWALSLGACFGGNGTLIGASANVVLADMASKNGHTITFASFLKVGVPVTAISVVLAGVYLLLRF